MKKYSFRKTGDGKIDDIISMIEDALNDLHTSLGTSTDKSADTKDRDGFSIEGVDDGAQLKFKHKGRWYYVNGTESIERGRK